MGLDTWQQEAYKPPMESRQLPGRVAGCVFDQEDELDSHHTKLAGAARVVCPKLRKHEIPHRSWRVEPVLGRASFLACPHKLIPCVDVWSLSTSVTG